MNPLAAGYFRLKPSQFRAGLLSFLLVVLAAAFTTPAAANSHPAGGIAEKFGADSLSAHSGTPEGFVFPRDAMAAQPAIENRKKRLKPPPGIAAGDAFFSIANAHAQSPRDCSSVPGRFGESREPASHPWLSRAPPSLS